MNWRHQGSVFLNLLSSLEVLWIEAHRKKFFWFDVIIISSVNWPALLEVLLLDVIIMSSVILLTSLWLVGDELSHLWRCRCLFVWSCWDCHHVRLLVVVVDTFWGGKNEIEIVRKDLTDMLTILVRVANWYDRMNAFDKQNVDKAHVTCLQPPTRFCCLFSGEGGGGCYCLVLVCFCFSWWGSC